MNIQTSSSFHIIGIAVRTTNENGQATQDIPQLWNRFFTEGLMTQIPGKADDTIYCLYTDYEKDHTLPYTTVIGCRVNSIDQVPEGFVGKTIHGGNYRVFTAKGDMEQGIVYKEWQKIWDTDIDRAFTTDFEVYGEKARDMKHAEVDIFIAVQS